MFAVFQDDGVIVMFHISKSTQEYVMTPRSSPPTKSHLGWCYVCAREVPMLGKTMTKLRWGELPGKIRGMIRRLTVLARWDVVIRRRRKGGACSIGLTEFSPGDGCNSDHSLSPRYTLHRQRTNPSHAPRLPILEILDRLSPLLGFGSVQRY